LLPNFQSRIAGREREKSISPAVFEQKTGVCGFLSFSPALRMGYLSLADAHVAQSVERVLGKDEVISSILIMGSRCEK
jgi:hypothetical protein